MGVLNDLGTGIVEDICPLTGYPRNEYGQLLDTLSPRDGVPVPDWDKKGTRLYNFTNPYGHLEFACGTGDDFHCFDYHKLEAGPRGEFMILDGTINSETGSFIMGSSYYVLPCNSSKEENEVLGTADAMVEQAISWCYDNEIRHSKKGWNQSPFYFLHAVARCLNKWKFEKASEREIRMGSKRVDKIITDCYKDKS